MVSSEGFNQSLNDFLNVHFTTQEYREFGARYAEKMIEILGDKINPVETEAPASSSSAPESNSEMAVSSGSDVAPAFSADAAPASSFGQAGIVATAPDAFAVGKVYRNGKNLYVSVNLSNTGAVNVAVYSSLGKVVSNFSGRYEAGENLISLNKGCLPAGVYMLSVQVNGSRAVKRFLVNQ